LTYVKCTYFPALNANFQRKTPFPECVFTAAAPWGAPTLAANPLSDRAPSELSIVRVAASRGCLTSANSRRFAGSGSHPPVVAALPIATLEPAPGYIMRHRAHTKHAGGPAVDPPAAAGHGADGAGGLPGNSAVQAPRERHSRDGNPGHWFLASGKTPARGSILPHLSAVSAAESGRMRMSQSGRRFLRTPTSHCSRGPSRR